MDWINIFELGRSTNGCTKNISADIHELLASDFPYTKIHEFQSVRQCLNASSNPDVVILAIPQNQTQTSLLEEVKEMWAQTPILGIVCTENILNSSVSSTTLQQFEDLLFCPLQKTAGVLTIRRVLQNRHVSQKRKISPSVKRIMPNRPLIGMSPAFRKVMEKISCIASTDATVLITGETGTGKELFARAIHYDSPRSDKPFVPINCGALPDHLFENEFFGHCKGAFTDAGEAQKGLIHEAEGGTLFLDEIDTLSHSAQIKLLRFMQEKEFRPLGSSKSFYANIRIIAATNAAVEGLVETNRFRMDLYYRLNDLALHLAPLRERIEDIPLLANHFVELYTKQYQKPPVTISVEGMRKLLACLWPGNVRELEAVIKREIILTSNAELSFKEDNRVMLSTVHRTHESFQKKKTVIINDFEADFLKSLLQQHQGNVSHAAKAAGKERRSFQRLLRKHNIDRSQYLVSNI